MKEVEENRREKEVEEEGKNIELNEQAVVLSIERRSDVRKSNASPKWLIELEVETYCNEQGGSSRQHKNISKILEMLKRMEKRMEERDFQLEVKLWERDKYFEEEIRRRY